MRAQLCTLHKMFVGGRAFICQMFIQSEDSASDEKVLASKADNLVNNISSKTDIQCLCHTCC